VRSDLPDAVARAVESCERAALVFDRARIAANLRTLAASARAHRITTLFAAKSFPHAEVWALAAEQCDGFDAASTGEVSALPPSRILSIVDPTGRAHVGAAHRGRLIVGCETVAQVERAPAHAEIAIRVSASITGRDPAIGAILDGTGHRRSRFGVDVRADDARADDARADDARADDARPSHDTRSRARDELRAMVRAADGRPVGVHVHHGPVTATSAERFVATAHAVLDLVREADVVPCFLDVGGAWHGIADLDGAFERVRAAVPSTIELIVEPGRAIAREAGFACGRVVVARELHDRSLRVVDLSRSCHLRWSQIELVGTAPHAGTGRNTLVVGATCYEDDVIGEWIIAPASLDEGARFALRGVTGYAVAWNTSFGGVPAADVLLL
jgi:diaminopimelate decarboxylase